MDYTQSDHFVVDVGTGFNRHEDSAAVTTAITEKDMNSLLWSVMEVVKAGGQAGQQFDAAVPATYKVLLKALKAAFGGNVTTVNAVNSPFVLTADHAGLVIMDATAGNIVANLPAVNVIAQPLKFNFVRADATVNTATVNRAGADVFVDGTTAFTLSGQGASRAVEGDSISKWAFGLALASSAEAQAFSSTVKLLSPATLKAAFQGANQSLAATGYQKLPGGLVLQWGSISGGSSQAFFPLAYTTVYRTFLTPDQNDPNPVIGQNVYDDQTGWPTRILRPGTAINAKWFAVGTI